MEGEKALCIKKKPVRLKSRFFSTLAVVNENSVALFKSIFMYVR